MNRHSSGESQSFPDGLRGAAPRGPVPSDWPAQVIQVEMDELVLTGFPRSQGPGIAEAIRETLCQLFADGQTAWEGHEVTQLDRLDAGTVHLSRSGRARSAGEQVARAVYRSLPK